MTKSDALAKCLELLKAAGHKLGGSYVYPDRDRVYVRSLKGGGPAVCGAAECFVEGVLRGEGWVFAVNNRIVKG